MPILDKFGNEIEHHIDFPNDLEVNNIEFGAGKNNYGKREHPKCYLTDQDYPTEDVLHFSYHNDYEIQNCHYLDDICHFYDYNFERKFENIILCNPFGYGFRGLADAQKFFNRAGDILSENGRIHIIGKYSNGWCKKESLDKYLKNEIEIYKSKYFFEIESFEPLDSNHSINTNYRFFECGLQKITIPNEKIIIKKL
jgi:hypothetical protein